jgi:hypothetical protein
MLAFIDLFRCSGDLSHDPAGFLMRACTANVAAAAAE